MSDAEVLETRLRQLWGDARGAGALPRLLALIDRWRGPIRDAVGEPRERPVLGERDIVLIAYGDHLQRAGEPPLATLTSWCHEHVRDLVSTVHVLPFHPSTSYEGYAISDYRAVDPALGTWEHLDALANDFHLMMDLVLNHCSASHPWFAQFLTDREPGRRYFIAVDDPASPWLASVHRARNLPLLHGVETTAGLRHVWTTYSPDLVDLNWDEPDVCLEMLEVLFDAIARGARMVRLDAFVYTWKKPGTSCVAQPETHELLRLFQDVSRAVGAGGVAILPSITNVTQARNYTYFGPDDSARQADLIYHLPLSALVLLSLYTGDARVLSGWLARLPPAPPGRAYLNVTATHDGIGLTWLEDLLPESEIRQLVERSAARGSLLSSRRATVGAEDLPWEINATWTSACAPDPGAPASHHAARILATQAAALALRGVPAIYLATLLAGRNDHARARAADDNRAINRGRFDATAWEQAVATPGSLEATVLAGLQQLLRARGASRAFHPEGAQRVLELDPRVLAIERTAPAGEPARVLCLTNFSAEPIRIPAALVGVLVWRDLVDESSGIGDVDVAPYQVRWLVDA